jgi:predicted DsbA family dithiol-disulfide isomerase
LQRYREECDGELEVDWHPFDLRARKRGSNGEIDHSVDDGKDEAYYEQAKENVRRLREEYGVEMTREIATDVDSLDAQVASYYVEKHHDSETWLEFDRAIFDALWKEGRDIGDRDLLADLAESVGVDGDEIRSALADDVLRGEVRELFDVARQRDVTGVPTFAYDGRAVSGAVPPERLERLVES